MAIHEAYGEVSKERKSYQLYELEAECDKKKDIYEDAVFERQKARKREQRFKKNISMGIGCILADIIIGILFDAVAEQEFVIGMAMSPVIWVIERLLIIGGVAFLFGERFGFRWKKIHPITLGTEEAVRLAAKDMQEAMRMRDALASNVEQEEQQQLQEEASKLQREVEATDCNAYWKNTGGWYDNEHIQMSEEHQKQMSEGEKSEHKGYLLGRWNRLNEQIKSLNGEIEAYAYQEEQKDQRRSSAKKLCLGSFLLEIILVVAYLIQSKLLGDIGDGWIVIAGLFWFIVTIPTFLIWFFAAVEVGAMERYELTRSLFASLHENSSYYKRQKAIEKVTPLLIEREKIEDEIE